MLPAAPAAVIEEQMPQLDMSSTRLVGADGNVRLFVGVSKDPAQGKVCGIALSEFPGGWLTTSGCADKPSDLLLKVQRRYGGVGTPTVAVGVMPDGVTSVRVPGHGSLAVSGNLYSFPTPNDEVTPHPEEFARP